MEEYGKKREIPEELVERYLELQTQIDQLEKEFIGIKKLFHAYFDINIGEDVKGESIVGDYKVQRIIRTSSRYDDEKTVKALEELQLADCIRIVKVPDQSKIEAAVTLGILPEDALKDCIIHKVSPAILVKKIDVP